MKKIYLVWVDLRIPEMVTWYNKIGYKLIKAIEYQPVVETTSNKKVGYLVQCKKTPLSRIGAKILNRMYEKYKHKYEL